MSFSINTNNFTGGNVNTSITPSNTGVSLGATGARFKDLYLESDSMYLGNVKLSESGGKLVVTDPGGNPQPLGVAFDIKNISSVNFRAQVDTIPTTLEFTLSKTITGLTIKTGILEFDVNYGRGVYSNDLSHNLPLIFVDEISSNCKRLCGAAKASSSNSVWYERNPVDNTQVTWNDQYNATQSSLGTYILGIYGTGTSFHSAYGFYIDNNRSSDNKLWLESASLENSGSNTIINFNFKQDLITGTLGGIECPDVILYGLS